MHASPSDEYGLYLRRCAERAPGECPLAREEFESVLRRLDDLYLRDLEGRLTPEERSQLIQLRHVLREQDDDAVQDASQPSLSQSAHANGAIPRTSRMGHPCPNAGSRRQIWLHRRRESPFN